LSVNFGTDALGGTINIITKKNQVKTFSFSNSNYYESNGQYNLTGKIGFQKKNNMISLSGGRNYFDGWRTNDKPFLIEKKRIADSLRHQDWKPKEQYFATLFYSHFFKKIKINYTGDYFYEKIINKGLPRAPYSETAFDDRYVTNRITNSINSTGNITKNIHINILVAHSNFNRIKNTYFRDLTNLNEILTENENDQDSSSFKNIMSRGTISSTIDSSKINAEIGYDLNHETATGLRIKNSKQQMGDYALFATAEYKPFSSVIIRPGVRAIYNTAYKAPIIPSLNIKLSPNSYANKKNSHAFRFSYARGYRAPSLKELYFFFVDINHNITGNENLKAEQSHNFNISYTYNTTKGQTSIKNDVILFYNMIENMISLAQVSGTEYSYFNIDQFRTNGIQLQNEISFNHLKLTLGVGCIGRYNQLQNTQAPEKFSYSPEAKFNIFYEWHKLQTTLALFYKYTGEMPGYAVDENNNIIRTTIDDYHMGDCSISKLFFNKKVAISIGAKNIFNIKNINGSVTNGAHTGNSNSITIGMGRTYFLKLDFHLNSKK
ncbi:MAG: TonB-dependent receptor, partial [Bacteroidia bacterium]|nr:TonB-dependent receptor [Bacteroidia bacterium]